MDDRFLKGLASTRDFSSLEQFEANAQRLGYTGEEERAAIKSRWALFGRNRLSERIGLDLSNLTPAEERIVQVVSEFIGIRTRQGKSFNRTIQQLQNRGLIGAAESAVQQAKPTQGFETLKEEDREDLSYEKIILDYPEEFSSRARWYARRTLGLPMEGPRPSSLEKVEMPVNDQSEVPYWVFVCNPAKWAVDKFLASGIDVDTWGVRPSDAKKFSRGQLGIVRVGVDQRSIADRNGHPRLEAGIYALCQVESEVFKGTGANDAFWAEGKHREAGWPTVRLRYLCRYLENPLTIERLRRDRPDLSPLLLDGFQASSFPISADEFHVILEMLGEDPDALPLPKEVPADSLERLAELEAEYLNASPEVKKRTSKVIERGPIGALVKEARGHRCQLCAALGMNPLGFSKADGTPYVEAHHVMPVSRGEIGSLSSSNIMTVCPNHHRQLHYGADITVRIGATAFTITVDHRTVTIPKFDVSALSAPVAPAM